jgi:hypothetical protein
MWISIYYFLYFLDYLPWHGIYLVSRYYLKFSGFFEYLWFALAVCFQTLYVNYNRSSAIKVFTVLVKNIESYKLFWILSSYTI